MAYRLDGAKPLSEPLLQYWELDPATGTNFNGILIEIHTSYLKIHLKMSSAKLRPFCLALDVLIGSMVVNFLEFL